MNRNHTEEKRFTPGALRTQIPLAPDSTALFAALTESGRRPHVLLLESAEPSRGRTQRSLLLTSAALRIESRGERVRIDALGENGVALLPALAEVFASFALSASSERMLSLAVPLPRDSHSETEEERLRMPSSLSILRGVLAHVVELLGDPRAVFLAGTFSYDLVEQFETLPDAAGGDDCPDYVFYLADELIEIDHIAGETTIRIASFCTLAAEHSAARMDEIEASIRKPEVPYRPATREASTCALTFSRNVKMGEEDAAFAAHVVRLKERIVRGDVFQIVLSRSFSTSCSDAFAAYSSLARLNPSPYLFYVNAGDFVLFGASPESSVKVSADGKGGRTIEISPIAGTRPRGRAADGSIDPDLDGRLEAELRLDEKENAEHMMLVDLARNDVARVSEPGSRYVSDFLRTERYSHVMHLASCVRGRLRADLDALDAYRCAMNMGTLTGSPKIRAMQLLREYEPTRRGHYGGAVGYLRGDGAMDTAIVIRSALVRDGVATVRAGAGIVHDSVPEAEADETRRKAAAAIAAIEISKEVA